MLIDGRKVLYSMKDRKLVYPEIPTEGLVCYLDARGKTNNDKHKGTLIDLSGNGNHGTLENFNFTEESGYVVGGLQFDGVDDTMSYSHNLKETGPRTIFMDIELEQSAKEQGISITLPFGLTVNRANDSIYNLWRASFFNKEMLKGAHKFVITIESTVETGKMYYEGNVITNIPQGDIGSYHYDPKLADRDGKKILNRAMLWNRVLTEQEITKLIEG